jgi:predicted PurR-regulated permease PerM
MAATWITIAASSLPEIIRMARPLFTRTPQVDNSHQLRMDVIGEQITELQDAATQNADSIKKLATDMQKTIEVLQVGADQAERRLRRASQLTLIATTVAVLAFALAAYALAR